MLKIQIHWKKFKEKRLRLTSIVFSIFDQTVSKTLNRRVEKKWPSSSSTLSISDFLAILGVGDSILRLLFTVPVNFPWRLLPDEALWRTKNGCHENGKKYHNQLRTKTMSNASFEFLSRFEISNGASMKSNETKFDGEREGTRISFSAVASELNESVVEDGG